MSDEPGRKADLDKEGITLQDANKAELDKDGIALEIEEALAQAPAPGEAIEAAKEPEVKAAPRKRMVIMAIAGAAGVLALVVVLVLALSHGKSTPPQKVANAIQTKKEAPFGQDGLVLDPFMVFYDTNIPQKSGVLLAQVSLKVDPSMISTIESRLYDIRSIIYKRLSSAASVYSQTEITLMLSDDLIDYPIQEVAFVQYSAK